MPLYLSPAHAAAAAAFAGCSPDSVLDGACIFLARACALVLMATAVTLLCVLGPIDVPELAVCLLGAVVYTVFKPFNVPLRR